MYKCTSPSRKVSFEIHFQKNFKISYDNTDNISDSKESLSTNEIKFLLWTYFNREKLSAKYYSFKKKTLGFARFECSYLRNLFGSAAV